MSRPIDLTHRREASWAGLVAQPLIWLAFATAGLLLMGLVAVLDGATKRGEERRLQQRTTGSHVLADERQRRGVADAGVLTAANGSRAAR